MKKKKIIRTSILAIIVFALVLFGGYTCLFSRTHYSFTRMTYSNGLLPDGFKNFKIVDLSDIHITTSKDIDRFEQIVDEIEDMIWLFLLVICMKVNLFKMLEYRKS